MFGKEFKQKYGNEYYIIFNNKFEIIDDFKYDNCIYIKTMDEIINYFGVLYYHINLVIGLINIYDNSNIKFVDNGIHIDSFKIIKKWTISEFINENSKYHLNFVKKNGSYIKYINNPTYEVCMEAIKQDGFNIQYIKNPTDEMYKEAIRQTRWAVDYISEKDLVRIFGEYGRDRYEIRNYFLGSKL